MRHPSDPTTGSPTATAGPAAATGPVAAAAPVTVLGLGAMGTALASALLRAGHPTTVWNRSPGRGADLVELGAVRAATPAEAAAAGDLVLVCTTDYAAARSVLDAAGAAVSGRVLVNIATGSPEEAHAMAARASGYGAD